MAGASLVVVARILGHKQLTTTQRYAHLSDESLAAAVDRIGLSGGKISEIARKEAEATRAIQRKPA